MASINTCSSFHMSIQVGVSSIDIVTVGVVNVLAIDVVVNLGHSSTTK